MRAHVSDTSFTSSGRKAAGSHRDYPPAQPRAGNARGRRCRAWPSRAASNSVLRRAARLRRDLRVYRGIVETILRQADQDDAPL
jgi:hypothetical protein